MKVLKISLFLLMLFSLTTGICYGQTAKDYFDKGIAYYEKGMYDKAIAEFKKALEINPNLAMAHYNLAVSYYYKGEYSLAIKHCDRLTELGYEVHPELLKALEPYRKR